MNTPTGVTRQNAVMGALGTGRHRELAELAQALADARSGRGAAVVVSGPAGIGKSWLLDGVAALADARAVPTVRGSAVSDAGMPDGWMWRCALTEGRALGLDPSVLDPISGVSAQARFLANAAVVPELVRAAEPDGLVVLLDDLHWADQPSVRLLTHVARGLAGTRVLVIATTRDPARLAALVEAGDVRWLSVDGWARGEVAAYLRAEAAGPFDPAWVDHLHQVTTGNPLYLRELVTRVRQTGGFARPPTEVVLPDSLRTALVQRLDGLSANGRSLVDAASVVGDEVAISVLAAVLGQGIDALTARLVEAVEAGVLRQRTGRTVGFEHPLLRRATYDSVREPGRTALHLAVAEALADGRPAADQVGPVAWHLVRAAVDQADAERAIRACRRSAAAAVAGGRTSEAADWFRRALELASLARLDAGEQAELLLGLAETEFGCLAVDDALRHCEAGANLAVEVARPDLVAQAALVVRGVGGAAVNRRITELCRRARRLLGPDVELAARLEAQLAMALIEETDEVPDEWARGEAVGLVRRLSETARGGRDPAAVVDIAHAQERLASGPGSGALRIELGARIGAMGTVDERPEAAVWAHLWRIDGFLQTGEVTRADAEIAGLAAEAERLAWPLAHWQLLRARAARATLSGDFAKAEDLARSGKELAERNGDASMLGQFFAYRLERQRRLGSVDGDDAVGVAALAEADPRPLVLAVAAEFLLAAGEEDLARTLYARLAPSITTLPANRQQPAIWSMAGELAVQFSDPTTAAHCRRLLSPYEGEYNASTNGYRGSYARPLAVLTAFLDGPDHAEHLFAVAESQERRVGAPAGLALAQLAHAQALRGVVRHEATVRHLVGAVIRSASPLRMAPTVAAAGQLLSDLDQAADAATSRLTAREQEIADLLADGSTNRAIATRLVISERTVESHVRNITAKLGLGNRTQVAAWALRSHRS